MNYELAKELKDAGFPQTFSKPREVHFEKDYPKEPTLSELIESCELVTGDGSFTLKYNEDKKLWEAGYEAMEMWWMLNGGNTPEESVAKLWLELNKK